MSDLPRNEDGEIIFDARFGQCYAVRVTWNTDPEGVWVAEDDWSNVTVHGTFDTKEEADEWLQAAFPDDTDVKDMDVVVINRVRPA